MLTGGSAPNRDSAILYVDLSHPLMSLLQYNTCRSITEELLTTTHSSSKDHQTPVHC